METTYTNFVKMLKEKKDFEGILPLVISVNSVPTYVLGKFEDSVSLTGIHPRMQQRIRALELIARGGKPPEKYVAPVFTLPDAIIKEEVEEVKAE